MDFTGLTDEEVREKTENGKINKCSVQKTKTIKDIVSSNVFTFFNLIFVILFALIIVTGHVKHTLFMFIIVANTLIGIIQEIKAKRTIDKLSLLSAPTAHVIRNGQEREIPTEEVVEGDLAVISAGEQIYADGQIIYGFAEVNESMLSGEADDIKKNVGDKILSGSFVTAGTIRCVIEKVGDECYASQIAAEAKKYKKVRSEIVTSFNKIVKVIGFIIIPLGLLLFLKQWLFLEMPPIDSIEKTAAALIGMIPEGLYLLTSVALAISVIRLAREKTLVQEMYSIESLARVDVICVDKTGTITSGEMAVSEIKEISNAAISTEDIIKNMLASAKEENITSRVLSEYFGKEKTMSLKYEIPFSSKRKWSGCVFKEGTFVLGAPEIILNDNYKKIEDIVIPYSSKGFRVLLLAEAKSINEDSIENPSPISLIILENKLRTNVAKTFSFFKENGVDVKVISGDNPMTVSAVAQRARIENAEKFIDLSGLSDDEVKTAANNFTVFGRVNPRQKKILIQELKNTGKTPAMVGDGVNDVLALREASCSIAMAQGSEAAKRVSNLILLNSDFDLIPKIIYEGRRVINNISRSSSLFLVKNIFSILLTFALLFLPFPFPYEPIQLTLISSMTIGIPSVILALEPDRNIIKGKFILNTIAKALPSAIADFFSVLAILTITYFAGIDNHAEIATSTILMMALIGFITVFRACVPFTKLRKIMFGSILGLFVLTVVLIGKTVLEFTLLPPRLLATVAVLAIIAIPMIHLLSVLIEKIAQRRENKINVS